MIHPRTIRRFAVARLAVVVATLAGGCASSPMHHRGDAAAIAAAVASADRPEADRVRDADRKPERVMDLMGVRPGMAIADLMAGGGYYTELLSRAVGPDGKVYLQNTPLVVQKFAGKQIDERLAGARLANVERRDAELTALMLPSNSLDAAFMVLFYHDTYWMGIDRPAMLAEIKRCLRPGGVFAVVDHAAAPGSKDRDVKTLHRVDEAIVMQEVLDAGFELVETADFLRHPEDDRTINVFKPEVRGKTDRFIFKFRKPG